MVDIRIRFGQNPIPLARILCEVLHHVFVNFFLQIDTKCPIGPDNLVSANTGIRGNVSARIRNPNVRRVISDVMVSPFNRRIHEALKEFFPVSRDRGNDRWPQSQTQHEKK
jgi:hypothetical protein